MSERWSDARRSMQFYRDLMRSDVVIVTLGLVEAWIDTSLDCYLNRMPPPGILRDQPGRYQLEVMEPFSAWTHLEPAFALLADTNVIVTVSPVPMQATFTANDVTIANTFSKAVLRVCAERLATLPNVDYFPSYEIVISAGLPAYQDDRIHVRDSVVREIVRYMLDAYQTE